MTDWTSVMTALESKAVKIVVWSAHKANDEGGRGSVIGYYSTKVFAEAAAKGKGWWGANGEIQALDALKVGNDVWLLAKMHPLDVDDVTRISDEALRKETLSNLTVEQRRVLGV